MLPRLLFFLFSIRDAKRKTMQANHVEQRKLKIECPTPCGRSRNLPPSYLHFLRVPLFFSISSKRCGCVGAPQSEDNTDHWVCPLTQHNDPCISQTYCHDNYCTVSTPQLYWSHLLIAKGTKQETVNLYIFVAIFFPSVVVSSFFYIYNKRVH
uniref:Uncharacterized protein n=1 Tax=Micrurus corallinus TaxID=54390 RepID=A0A2D4H4B6_MICCO